VQVQTHVPVRWHLFSPPPSGYAAGSITVDPSTVLVSGPKADVSQVTQVLVYIDLSGIRSSVQGVYPAFPVDSRGTTVASHLVSVSPTQVRVTVPISSPSRYRTLPIVPAVTGQPKGGLGVVSMVTSPSNVTVYGAPPQLSHAGSLLTAPISIAGRGAGTFKQTAKLRAPRGVQLSTYRATVTVTIGAVNSSTSTEVQLVALNSPPGLLVQLRPSRVLVTAVGSPRALQTTAGQIQAVLNLAGFGAGTYKLQPSLRLPAGLNLVSAYPSQITVVLTPSR
jgi:YbbR domain-containing protein